jgi:hypothetical protein
MRPIAVSILTVLLVAACSAAPATTSPSPRPSVTVVTPSPSPSLAATPVPRPSPSTPAAPPSAPVVGQAPAGSWSALHWLGAGPLPLNTRDVTVRGWSGGFVAFEQSPGSDENGNELPVVIRATSSSDGLHWSAPTTVKTGFKGSYGIGSIVEGPGGLLALGYPYGDTCGGPQRVFALWSSADGRSWERLSMPKQFTANNVQTISGGRAGFIAFGSRADGTTPAIWTSMDGRAWASRALPVVSSGKLALDAAVSFDSGYVLLGAVLGEEGCGGPAHVKPAVWHSADGSSWTRADLPGALKDPSAYLRIRSSGDRLLVTQVPQGDITTAPAWTSTDGVIWSSAGAISPDVVWGPMSDGRHAVMVVNPESGVGLPRVTGVDGTGATVVLRQDGDEPLVSEDVPGYVYAVGPTGLLAVRYDGGASWLGVPS